MRNYSLFIFAENAWVCIFDGKATKAAAMARLEAAGRNHPASLFVGADSGRLVAHAGPIPDDGSCESHNRREAARLAATIKTPADFSRVVLAILNR